jgi:DNA-binding beta-propeller fold protein YncE
MAHARLRRPLFVDFLDRRLNTSLAGLVLGAMIATLILSLTGVDDAAALTLKLGDILVVDAATGVIHIDPETGTQTIITQGGFLNTSNNTALAIALEENGQILVLDVAITFADGSSRAGIVRVDPATGTQTLVTTGNLLTFPRGIAVEPDGQIVVVDQMANTPPRVIQVDPVTGSQTLVTTNGEFSSPRGITVVSRSLSEN